MYSTAHLSSLPYFTELFDHTDISAMLDPLTGVLSRAYITRYIRYLIEKKEPFALGLMDLDNFKSVNDNYGHRAGDGVLIEISESLRMFLGRDGVIGRFGGDEFLVVYLKSNKYDDVHAFYGGVYESGMVLRRLVDVGDISLFVTATVGSASFPTDAADYDALFAKIDKTLYRGKSKGRNCYIIYVESKHASLEITMLAKHSLYETLFESATNFDEAKAAINIRMQRAFAPIAENLRFYKLYYVNNHGQMKDPISSAVLCEDTRLAKYITKGGVFPLSSLDELRDKMPDFYETISGLYYNAIMLARVSRDGKNYGFLVACPEPSTMRMWQDDESTAVYFLSRLVATFLAENNLELT